MSETVERVAKRISRMIPVDGSRWNAGYGHNFPHEYSGAEITLIRGIACAAVEEIEACLAREKEPG